jgi:hypothetical protein
MDHSASLNGLYELCQELNQLSHDFRGEVLVAELLSADLNNDSIVLKNRSIFKRFVERDIYSVSVEETESNNRPERISIELNRDGLYDILPEGVFHAPFNKNERKDYQEEYKKRLEEETSARLFFSPFETQLNKRLVSLEQKQREFAMNRNAGKNRLLFEYFFGNSVLLNDKQVLKLIYLLPLVHKVRGDVTLIAQVLGLVLNKNVFVKKYADHVNESLADKSFEIENKIGKDFILNTSINYCQWTYRVAINELSASEYDSFILDGSNKKIIDFLTDYLFPANANIIIDLNVKSEEQDFILTLGNKSILNFNTYIC